MLIALLALSLVPLVMDHDAKALQLAAPASVGQIDTGKLKGEPTELAWSPDGTSLFLQTSERDSLGMRSLFISGIDIAVLENQVARFYFECCGDEAQQQKAQDGE